MLNCWRSLKKLFFSLQQVSLPCGRSMHFLPPLEHFHMESKHRIHLETVIEIPLQFSSTDVLNIKLEIASNFQSQTHPGLNTGENLSSQTNRLHNVAREIEPPSHFHYVIISKSSHQIFVYPRNQI